MRCVTGIVVLVFLSLFTFAEESTPPPAREPEWNAAQDLTRMQGDWIVTQHYIGGLSELPLGREGDTLRIDGNRLSTPDTETPVALANDLVELAHFRGGHEDDHYMVFTLPEGKALLAGYHVNGDQLVIRYPHTCTCSRSGVVTTLTRVIE